MALQSMDALSSHHIPNLGSVVERCGHDLVTLGVEIQRNDLGLVPVQIEEAGALLDIPDLCRMVHGTSRSQHAMWVEA